ncbi:dihydroorotate dehydrogenase B (NAD(+)), electron transfer subunit [Moorella sp. E308F]|jgi:dihydroorotate dehydrogenase electron transfer subunit|uniref:dihydroorotate dehydrogenase electron transfer subunit n=1 Tax=unclassified Neomoorella TaxID=2676739 RepID=UPI0010FFB962|nr:MULTISPECIES: dihydroorotate dehydrogenase electron transfer subunit [unclassified Moorella (in: firmicutes)]GEA14072.1 dihydroorotate dehydrogenase B (NAD(+)), electron transfer subunit [Moorella sp. E308F]GEA18552.1 dihydroorotate dehydrogenase B (NAD(+)), electron transfer subunit [Moorella sp. E306M]
MLIQNLEAEILASHQIGREVFLLKLQAPAIAAAAQPGQFVHIRCSETLDPLLRRPLSIHDVGAGGELFLLYQVKGRGTAWLARQGAGKKINILGPIGRGFTLPANKRVALVAGGLGIVPLLFLARRALEAGNEVDFFYGAQDRERLYQLETLKAMKINLFVATDDGSEGFYGPVTKLWEHYLEERTYDRCYACGPRAGMAEFARLASKFSITAEVSLEERMACGLGACRGCVTALLDAQGKIYYENVCTGGPVFDAATVYWGDQVKWNKL